jgi:DNA-binding response OmpR family regulator
VTSELGVGTTFTIWLPLAARSAVVQQPATRANAALGRGEHILYVDDDEAINFLIQRLLTKAGYRVTGCEDPTQARSLFAAQANDFDVVVTDLAMPAMSGFDLIQQLRAVRSDIPIIMTSGYVRESDQELASSLGIGRIILKPDTIDELGREVDARCTQLRLRRAQTP